MATIENRGSLAHLNKGLHRLARAWAFSQDEVRGSLRCAKMRSARKGKSDHPRYQQCHKQQLA